MQKSESKQLVGSQTWKGPPRLVVLNYVKQSPSLMAQWIKLPFQGENFQCFCKDGIHHFTNCSSDWLWPLWSVPGNTSLLRDAFIPQLARLGSITKPPFSIQLLTDSLSLCSSPCLGVLHRLFPYLKATGDWAGSPSWAAPSDTIRTQQQLPQGARPESQSESGTGHHSCPF